MMEGSDGFPALLREALEKRARWLETEEIPRFQDTLRSYKTQVDAMMDLLIRKGLLKNDPYNYDPTVTEIVVPSDAPLPEIEGSDEASFRLAAYRRQLDFIVASCPSTLASLELARLKKITGLLAYIDWTGLGEGSHSPITRAFARCLMKVRMGSDAMASKIVKDSQVQMEKVTHRVRSLLAEFVSYRRESWKSEIRASVLPQLGSSLPGLIAASAGGRREEALRAVRKVFGQAMAGRPWYPELVDEIFLEEGAENASELRAKLLEVLKVPEPKREKPVEAPDARPILLEAVRLLGRCHEELRGALETLVDNERAMRSLGKTLGQRIMRWFLRTFRQSVDDRTYEVRYQEPAGTEQKTESIDFPRFIAEARGKADLLSSIAQGSGSANRALDTASDDQLLGFFNRLLNDLFLIHRRMGDLNALIQARAAKGSKVAVKGIRLELMAVKNAIAKANDRRHEYISRSQERKGVTRRDTGG